jgi:hypothetical protein
VKITGSIPVRATKYHFMPSVEFKEKFVAFLDVLGFKNLVEAAEAGTTVPLNDVLEVLRELGSPEERLKFEKHGPKVCPQSAYIQRNLDFQITQVSDCFIVSSEISPAGAINLINYCWTVVLLLMDKGFLCRGYITKGPMSHDGDKHFFGTGYHKALNNERNVTAFKRDADERGTPFVEVDRLVCDYVTSCEDRCVKEMFSRFVQGDGKVMALFPFKRLAHRFIVAGFGQTFDAEQEKRSNENVRSRVRKIKETVMSLVDSSNPNAVSKAEHYIRALDAQLDVCDRTDEFITKWKSSCQT